MASDTAQKTSYKLNDAMEPQNRVNTFVLKINFLYVNTVDSR